MVTSQENESLTRVGPGTPGGEFLRRYWHPVAAAAELTIDQPIKAVQVLGEKLVVYRDTSGTYGLVAEQCPHRLASLAYGSVDDEGIKCPYHGWKFDGQGKCLETPAEPRDSTLKDAIGHAAYPVERLGGLLFAYLGPGPAPALPRWDVLAWETQGPVADRAAERFGAADKGIHVFRTLIAEQIETVPLGVNAGNGVSVIELEVINERIGLTLPQTELEMETVTQA